MTRLLKCKNGFRAARHTYSYSEFEWLLLKSGYQKLPTGQRSGSRRKYYNSETEHLVMCDEPHDGVMTTSMIKRLQDDLRNGNVI